MSTYLLAHVAAAAQVSTTVYSLQCMPELNTDTVIAGVQAQDRNIACLGDITLTACYRAYMFL